MRTIHLEKKSPKPSSQAGLNGEPRSPPPRSFASPAPSGQSRATQRSRVTEKQSTAYPPLPPSQSHSNIGSASAVKYQRTYSRAPSLSPSDSPSQMKAQRNVVRSVGREPSLPTVPPSDGDSQAEGDLKPGYSQQNGDGEFRSSEVFLRSCNTLSALSHRGAVDPLKWQ
jgi:hypothetical protein